MNAVTQKDYKAAAYGLDKLNAAIIAVRDTLDMQVVGSDNLSKIVKVHEILKHVRDSKLSILDKGNQQFENRNQELINKAPVRLHQTASDVEIEQKRMQHIHNSLELKRNLLLKNFSSEEAERIIEAVPQSDIDASNALIAALEKEAKTLKAFIDDAPHYDVSLLKGTSLEQTEEVEIT